jgi:hypothetical protein
MATVTWQSRRNRSTPNYETFIVDENVDATEARRERNRLNLQLGWPKYRIQVKG